jgi:cell division protein FtsW
MGESTFIRNDSAATRENTQRRKPHSQNSPLDVTLVVVVIILMAIGLVMVYSSSWYFSIAMDDTTTYAVIRQAGFLVVGSLIAFIVSRIDYHFFKKFLVLMMATVIVLLVGVLLFGQTRLGARRSILFGSFQPSEFAKLAVIIYLSFWLFNKREQINSISFGLVPLICILGIFSGLIFLQPDLSAALTIIVLGGVLFFMAEADIRQIVFVIICIVILGAIMIVFSQSGQARIKDFLAGLQDPIKSSEHIRRSLEAIVNGGLFGVGIGKGVAKVTGLPVAWTDSIFAVIAEEMGVVGAIFVILLYVVFLWRGLKIAQKAPDMLGKLLAGGITFWIIWEALINMGVMVSIFPFAGNALPLVSSGGSSLVSILIGIGILINISRMSNKPLIQQEGRSTGAVVNLRRRDGRRRVSRSGRLAGNREK